MGGVMRPEAAMGIALSEARRASGRTFPNPPVGAVVFRGSRVLGRGRTRPVGGPHAEIVALGNAARRHGAGALRGASMAVTLEPCCHAGRTAACTAAIIEAGLARVIVGHLDPHPRVSGRGARQLRGAGLRVEVGVSEDECRIQHRGFLSVTQRGRPYVTLKLASSLDGRIATAAGESRWITGAPARAAVHRLRARVDAILVGSGTALADDPRLAARRGDQIVHRPVRVLVDSRLRVPPTAALYDLSAGGATWVLTRRGSGRRRRQALEAAGARLLDVPVRGGHLDLRAALRRLAREGLTQLLVEGGGELAAALLRKQLVDDLHWWMSPLLLGGDGRPALGPLGIARLAKAIRLPGARLRRSGADFHIHASLEPGGGVR